MGCDIHCYVEYKRPNYGGWSDFGGRINPGRDYSMFSAMAGVRTYDEKESLFKPRGLPRDLAWAASDDSKLYICDSKSEKYVTPEQAEKYVRDCGCKYINSREGKPTWVTHPDWHSYSWLSAEEFSKVVEEIKPDVEYFAMAAAMNKLTELGMETRVVFWFDN